MGYFKTLTIDPSAAREYSQRWAQKDQVRDPVKNTHLASGQRMFTTLTTTTVPQPVNITREHVGRALYSWRKNVEHNPRDLNALNHAALNLEANPWYMTPDGELVITSASDSRKRYHVNVDGCDCRAAMSGKPCWHVAAYRVLHTAEAMRRLEASQKAAQHDMECVQVLVDELV
jgi:hypothetical protein